MSFEYENISVKSLYKGLSGGKIWGICYSFWRAIISVLNLDAYGKLQNAVEEGSVLKKK